MINPSNSVAKSLLTLLIFSLASLTVAQNRMIDSLKKELSKSEADTNMFNVLIRLGNSYQAINPDTAIYYHERCLELAIRLKIPVRKCKAMVMLASDNLTKGNLDKAIELHTLALPLAKANNMKTVEAKIYGDMALIYKRQTNFGKALEYQNKALEIFEELKIPMGVMANLGNLGSLYKAQSNFTKALECYSKVLKIQDTIGNHAGKGITYGNMGNVYHAQGKDSKAIEYFLKALRIDEEHGNKIGVARHLGNIGNIYLSQKDIEKALQYYNRSLKINEELGLKPGIASNLGNIGLVYADTRDYRKALEYLNKAMKINEELGDSHEALINLSGIGRIYEEQGDEKHALNYQLKVAKTAEELGLKDVMATALGQAGKNFIKLKRFSEAEASLNNSLAIFVEIGAMEHAMKSNSVLHDLHSQTGNHKLALAHYKNFVQLRDSIINKENTKKQVEQEMQYGFDKKEALASAEQAKKDAVSREELSRQKFQRNGFIGGFALMMSLAVVSYRSFRNKSKANAIISEQKEEVERQRTITENQKLLVEEKNKEILDSITYAKRLQLAILPPARIVKELLPESFILYKPKDIVAGDFYWMEKINDTVLFAAADCTGHGVPGAMVSVVCSNALNRAVKEFGITEPGKILDKVRELVIETFEKSESEVKDGMDISLVSLVKKNENESVVTWSGANNPLWMIRNSQSALLSENLQQKLELVEVKPDKQPIGSYPDSKPFTTHSFKLQKNDTLYIFTDGFGDQFGGEQGKKLKSTNFKKLLLTIQEETMQAQSTILDNYFENWKGKLEQLDDVCMIGVKI